MIESASIKKTCFNGNPEKIVFGLNIRTISRSQKKWLPPVTHVCCQAEDPFCQF